MPSLNETVTKSKHLPAWTGSSDDFRRLLRLMERQFDSLIPQHVQEETRYLRGRLAHPQKQLQSALAWGEEHGHDGYAKMYVESERARLEAEIEEVKAKIKEAEEIASAAGRIELSLTSKDNERRIVTGTADELVEYIDGRDIQEMEVSGPSGAISGHSIMMRASRRVGLHLRVSSTDAKWCLAGFSEIEGETKRQVPRWHALRTRQVLLALFMLAAFSLLYFVLDAVAKVTTETGKYSDGGQFWAYLILATWSVMIGFWGMEWTRRHVPAFEIVPNGGRSRGKAIVGIVASTVGALVLGLAVNGLSGVIF